MPEINGIISVPEVKSFTSFLHNEKVRIYKTGYNYFIGLSLAAFYYILLPRLCYPLYKLLPHENQFLLALVGFPLVICISLFICNSLINIIYKIKHPYFEQYKISKSPWPWETDPVGYSKEYSKIVINTIVGNTIVLPLLLYPFLHFDLVHFQTDLESFPSSSKLFVQTCLFVTVFETMYYWLHRLFHTPWFYKNFHKQHHEYKITVSIAALYNNPFDYLITNLIPALVCELLFSSHVHIFTSYIWHFYLVAQTSEVHSGYRFPWFPFGIYPFAADISYHDYHHSRNVGNYGNYSMIWDTICGTNKHFVKHVCELENSDSKSN